MAAVWLQFPEFTPVSIKSALALIAQVLRKDSFEGTQAVDGLDVPHNPDHDDRRGFNDGDRLYFFSFRLLCWKTENFYHSDVAAQENTFG